MADWKTQDVERILANPYYCLPGADREPIIPEREWIKANVQLIQEIGAEKWLKRLLDNLRDK